MASGTASQVPITPGTGGNNVATWQILESSSTKQIQRVALTDAFGSDLASAVAPIASVTAENVHQFKTAAGILLAISAVNLTNTEGFLLVIDTNAIPIDGAISPVVVWPLSPLGIANIEVYCPMQFNNGIVAVLSSNPSPFVKTTGTITGFISCQFI